MIDILASAPTLILPLNKDKEFSEKGKKISISQIWLYLEILTEHIRAWSFKHIICLLYTSDAADE